MGLTPGFRLRNTGKRGLQRVPVPVFHSFFAFGAVPHVGENSDLFSFVFCEGEGLRPVAGMFLCYCPGAQ